MLKNHRIMGLGITAALGATSATSQAADVKVYGKALAAIANTSASEADDSETYISSTASRFGVKAVEKLSNGFEGIAVYEFSVDLRQKSSVIGKRDQYMGLKTNFGTILMGYKDTPYKAAKSEPFADTFADQNALLSNGIELRAEDAIYFQSNDYSGFTLYAAYSDSMQSSFAGSKGLASFSLTYDMKPFKVALAWQNISQQDYDNAGTPTSADDITATKLVVSGSMGKSKFGLTYEMIADETGDTSYDRTNIGANGSYRSGEWEGLGEYIMAGETKLAAGKDGATMLTVAAKRHLSDKFSYYFMASVLTNDENATFKPNALSSEVTVGTAKESYTTAGVGMIFSF